MENSMLSTPRLVLKAATADTLALAIDDRLDALGRSIDAHVATDWPPLLDDN
jgi:hypothetical protein